MKKNLVLFFWVIPLLAFGDGGSVTSNRYNDSLFGGSGQAGATGPAGSPGPAGITGAMGATGPAFSSSFGQLYLSSSQSVTFSSANTYVAVPFNAFSPSNNVDGSTSSPATMTILEAGVYQLDVSLYFSSEDSPESTFTPATYTLGIDKDSGGQVAATAVYAGEAGFFSLNYSTIVELAVDDTLQFYIKASAVGAGSPFDNLVSMVSGNAYVMQISE